MSQEKHTPAPPAEATAGTSEGGPEGFSSADVASAAEIARNLDTDHPVGGATHGADLPEKPGIIARAKAAVSGEGAQAIREVIEDVKEGGKLLLGASAVAVAVIATMPTNNAPEASSVVATASSEANHSTHDEEPITIDPELKSAHSADTKASFKLENGKEVTVKVPRGYEIEYDATSGRFDVTTNTGEKLKLPKTVFDDQGQLKLDSQVSFEAKTGKGPTYQSGLDISQGYKGPTVITEEGTNYRETKKEASALRAVNDVLNQHYDGVSVLITKDNAEDKHLTIKYQPAGQKYPRYFSVPDKWVQAHTQEGKIDAAEVRKYFERNLAKANFVLNQLDRDPQLEIDDPPSRLKKDWAALGKVALWGLAAGGVFGVYKGIGYARRLRGRMGGRGRQPEPGPEPQTGPEPPPPPPPWMDEL